MAIPPEQWEICLKVLQQIADEPTIINQNDRIKSLIAKIYKQGRKELRQTQRQQQTEDRQLRALTTIVQHQQRASAPLPELASSPVNNYHPPQLNQPIPCYICKQPYTQLHFFYHSLCPSCAEFNYQKRQQYTNLAGRVALVTGGRIKIGYQMGLRLLRDGARVIITTRFPYDCAYRYSLEPDFQQWCDRLQIYGLDLRHISAVETFVQALLHTESALDIIINNAAQTIKRPLGFYQQLLHREQELSQKLTPSLQALVVSACHQPQSLLLEAQPHYHHYLPKDYLLSNSSHYFPLQHLDPDGQQLDIRPTNSWLLKLNQVSTIELLEVQLVNAIAPFIFNSKLKPMLMRSLFERRFVINVSAMEGQFSRDSKTPNHPHTNMAKAALNMMTRTAAADYAQDHIYMNSVDTGWITNENPYPVKRRMETEQSFYTPLDVIDGMARIYDPIVQGIENPNIPLYGYFLKDYTSYPW
ncbi:MAG: SDR family oxidoreductase [Symploca sp. SIO2G7]|nr:SDR family oxidoreductase [Symploca sp. SIO2G7]